MSPEQAFDEYHEAVYRFAYRMTRRADAAEDVTQECFLALLRHPERFRADVGTMKTYLFAIARNLSLKHYRADCLEELPDQTASAYDAATSMPLSWAVEQAVAALPALQQEALILFEYEGCTLEEIAKISGTDAGAVKSRLHRARASLRQTLAPLRKTGERYGTA